MSDPYRLESIRPDWTMISNADHATLLADRRALNAIKDHVRVALRVAQRKANDCPPGHELIRESFYGEQVAYAAILRILDHHKPPNP